MANETQVAEPVKNCAGCKKQIKRSKRYYRNGAYYCNKNCYKKKMEEDAPKSETSAEAAQEASSTKA